MSEHQAERAGGLAKHGSANDSETEKLVRLEAEISSLCGELAARDEYIAELQEIHVRQMQVYADTEASAVADAASVKEKLNAVHSSTSWRITRPLREAVTFVRKMRRFFTKAEAFRASVQTSQASGTRIETAAPMDPDPEALRIWAALLYRHDVKRKGHWRAR